MEIHHADLRGRQDIRGDPNVPDFAASRKAYRAWFPAIVHYTPERSNPARARQDQERFPRRLHRGTAKPGSEKRATREGFRRGTQGGGAVSRKVLNARWHSSGCAVFSRPSCCLRPSGCEAILTFA